MLLMIDNYDSFTYNLVQELGELGAELLVERNDAIDLDGLRALGIDPTLGVPRFTFDSMELMEGIGFVPVIMGLFGISEVLLNAEEQWKPIVTAKMSSLWPSKADLKESTAPILRGSSVCLSNLS